MVEDSCTGKVNVDFLAGVLAVGFMWAVCWSRITMGFSGANDVSLVAIPVMLTALGQTICVGVTFFFVETVSRIAASSAAVALLSVASVVSSMLIQANGFGFVAVLAVASFVFGVTSGFLWADMALFLSHRNMGETVLCLSIGSIVGALLLMCGFLLVSRAGEIFMFLFAPASLILFLVSHRCRPGAVGVGGKSSLDQGFDAKAFWGEARKYDGLCWVILVFGIVFGMQIGMGFNGDASLAVAAASFLVPGVLMVTTYYVFKRSVNFRTLCFLVLMLALSALLPWLSGNGVAVAVRVLVVYVAFTLFDLSGIATLVEVGKEDSPRVYAFVVSGRFLVMVATLVGMGAALALSAVGDVSSVADSLSVLLLVAVFSRFTFMRGLFVSKVQEFKDTPKQKAIRELSERRGLSKREGEVLRLLAKGYNTKRIEEELFISGNTVKSHLYRIYAKLGVHTQQDVIRLIEDVAKTHGR